MMNASDDFGPDLGADMSDPIDDHIDTAMDDADLGHDMGPDQYSLDDSPLPVLPSPEDVAQDAMSPWETSLADLEDKLNDIPVGDFRAVIDSLNRVAAHAENIRSALVTEGKRTFLDYLKEAQVGDTTLGNNQNDAIKALHARMGGKPQDLQAARDKFNELRKSGVIKPKGSSFTMATMDDDAFNASISAPTKP